MSLIDRLRRLSGSLEESVDELRHRLKRSGGYGPIDVVPFVSHATDEVAYVRGRVLEDRGLLRPLADDSPLTNLLSMYKRFDSREVPGARVGVRAGGRREVGRTDREGYFRIEIRPFEMPVEAGWATADVDVPGEPERGIAPGRTEARIRVPSSDADYGVVSDVDDTILRTDARSLVTMARLTFFENARTRLPFHGVAAFYRALVGGREGDGDNPVFYVSSSPWNLYDLLLDFLTHRKIPLGPLFLRDVGLSARSWLGPGHREHKLARIDEILTTHRLLPFVLVGDTGQEDPEIYAEVVRRHPGRILAVYIRDVTHDPRDLEIVRLADRLRAHDVEMVLVADSAEAAEHAVSRGLVPSAALDDVRRDSDRDAAPPEAVEREVEARVRDEARRS